MLKVAAAQTFVSADIAENGRAIRKLISSAAAQGVRVINFCEGALSGYGKFQIMAQDDWQTYDWAAQDAELRAIAELCGKLRIFAVVGGAGQLSIWLCDLHRISVRGGFPRIRAVGRRWGSVFLIWNCALLPDRLASPCRPELHLDHRSYSCTESP
ncbi:nitrilase-related carbon-nitrogen hydrolase [Rhizobium phaseoli]|uniref:nitrilase-related carbon-nitrogen hydrolase n=1 Tax=Rhizobium phaseoli TaxID=396 RepID=UPI001F16B766|nr:nitrilase-related carbon-nitrogen hydrolase [Rhizobium phaseoli]